MQFGCCGVNKYEDWYDIDAWPEKKVVPESCCLPHFQNTTGRSESKLNSRLILIYFFKIMLKVLGETFSIKERKIKT